MKNINDSLLFLVWVPKKIINTEIKMRVPLKFRVIIVILASSLLKF